jgi:RNA polymerase sigma-70 factor (ECF subfamily)
MATDFLTIQRAIEGDERALRALWSQHAPHIDAVVRRLAGDPDLAEDIAQEVWIQIFRALPSYRGESQFGTWAHRIAVNRTLNALRRTRRLVKIETDMEEETVAVEHTGDRAMLRSVIDAHGLPDARRRGVYARGNCNRTRHNAGWFKVAAVQGPREASSSARAPGGRTRD